jgi:hypothetical protein
MNEQIRKIESQVWEQVKRTDGLVRTDDFIQKFAELLVRECADIAADMSALDIYEEIREHFGVEQ